MTELRRRSEAKPTIAETRVSDPRMDRIVDSAARQPIEADYESDVGQVVEATWGDEFYQVVQYNGFRVGPFKAMSVVRPGETIASALLRLHAELNEAALVVRRYRGDSHIEELKRLGIGVR
jgi:hypothetical protein